LRKIGFPAATQEQVIFYSMPLHPVSELDLHTRFPSLKQAVNAQVDFRIFDPFVPGGNIRIAFRTFRTSEIILVSIK